MPTFRSHVYGGLLALLVVGLAAGGCADDPGSDAQTAGDSIATAAPTSTVLLAPLDTTGDAVRLGAMAPATQRSGYDNQPAFAPDDEALLWTSIRGGQSDVYRRSIRTGDTSTTRLTATSVSEYSPTPQSGGGLSVVRVEEDGRQRLWHYSAQGDPVEPILPEADSVGYHAWLDPDRVALFVLGDPPTLHLANTETGRDTVIASRIGRSLRSIPGGSAVSFVRVREDLTTAVYRLDDDNGVLRTRRLTSTPGAGPGTFHAWTPGGTLLMATDQSLRAWEPVPPEWRTVAPLENRAVTRLAVSPSAEQIALVDTE
jgi:Tol biopolymer transport system component